jgi:hypothetical protein
LLPKSGLQLVTLRAKEIVPSLVASLSRYLHLHERNALLGSLLAAGSS